MRIGVVVVVWAMGLAVGPRHVAAAATEGGLADMVVPLAGGAPEQVAVETSVRRVLAGIVPEAAEAPRSTVATGGEFVLWGNLFGSGRVFALLELGWADEDPTAGGGVGLAEWRDGRWTPRGAWRITTIWRPAGWEESKDDPLPATPAVAPFSLEDLSGDDVPEVIVAGQVWRYFQEHYVLRFDPVEGTLRLVADAMDRPVRTGEFVRLYFDSGRRAIFSQWEFCRWVGEDLVSVATWHSEAPYNNIDPLFSEVTSRDDRGRPVVTRVSETDLTPEFAFPVLPMPEEQSVVTVSTPRQPFARVTVRWKPWVWHAKLMDVPTIEAAWWFERLSGLPRTLFPEAGGIRIVEPLESFATVTVEGDTQLARTLTGR